MPTGALVNTALYDHCPELVAAFVERGDEMIGHGHSDAERQAGFGQATERELLQSCSDTLRQHGGQASVWLALALDFRKPALTCWPKPVTATR
ncbi:MAG: chitin deacetylase 1-like [Polaromonas sp.]|nr:chitin deacetylase 1-like [Polaromonas sp.]